MEGPRFRRGNGPCTPDQNAQDTHSDDEKPLPESRGSIIRPSIVLAAVFLIALTASWRWRGARPETSSTLYTPEELSKYKGKPRGRILLAVMGSVFDVTAGRQYYGPQGGYSFFAGRDATRGYVTGDFKADLHDDISDFSPEQHAEAVRWREFYASHKKYTFAGRVIGKFYDKEGDPTRLIMLAETKAELFKEIKGKGAKGGAVGAGKKDEEAAVEILCDSSWSVSKGGWVYCENGMYPRRVLVSKDGVGAGVVRERCVCFPTADMLPGQRLYKGCEAGSERCQTSLP